MATNTPLTFTAEQANSTIRLSNSGASVNLQYSTDGSTWQTFTVGTTYTLANVGDYMMLRAPIDQPNTQGFYPNKFVMSGKIAGSGSLMSIIDGTDTLRDVSNIDDCFNRLFYQCTALTTAPDLTAEKIGSRTYCWMFASCSSLRSCKIAAKTFAGENSFDLTFYSSGIADVEFTASEFVFNNDVLQFYETFNNTSNLTSVTVPISNSQLAQPYVNEWFRSPSNNGTFYATNSSFNPDAVVRGIGTIPVGWTIEKKASALTFTAAEANSTITLNAVGSPVALNLEYSTDGETWQTFTVGTTYTLANVGDYMMLRAPEGSPNLTGMGQESSHQHRFAMTGKIAASGNIMSLYDKDGETTAVTNYGFYHIFADCSSLTTSPELPADVIGTYGYDSMFQNCTSLSQTGAFGKIRLINASSFKSMFENCTSLTVAPEIDETEVQDIGDSSHRYMFKGCTSLVDASGVRIFLDAETPKSNIRGNAFNEMFKNCYALTEPLAAVKGFPTTGVAQLGNMFENCTSLQKSPIINIGWLANWGASAMFLNCSMLNEVTVIDNGAMLGAATGKTNKWLSGVAPTGTLYYTNPDFNTSIARGVDTVPVGWNIVKLEPPKPLKKFFIDGKEVSELFIDGTEVKLADAPIALKGLAFKANADNSSVQLNKIGNPVDVNLEYAVNSAKDEDFQPYTVGTAISLDEGDIMLLRAPEGSSNLSGMGQSAGAKHKFTMTGSIAASGNIMRLYDKDGETSTITNWGFSELFHDCTALTEGPGSTATSIGQGAYHQLFMGCSNMVRVGTFADATATGIYAYGQTFSGCSSLTAVQDKFDAGLDSGQSGTFAQAFENCVSLLHAPSLRFRNGEKACQKTFQGCTSIVDAGDISCVGCTNYMFQFMYDGCSALAAPPMFYHEDPTTHEISDQYTAASHSHGFLFRGCSSMASVPNFKITTYANRADYTFEHLFDGCTSLVDASGFVMPTTYSSGAEAMLQNLFDGCTSLTAAPEIPSYNLGPYAFQYAFRNCTALTEAPELPSTTLARTCYSSMFQGCTSLEKPPQFYGPITGLSQNCMQNMFNGCTSLTSTPAIDETAVQSVSNNSHADMFARCSALVDASGIKLSKVAYEYGNSCYAEMFLDCTNLSVAPAEVCINGGSYTSRAGSMFRHCQGLKNTPLIISNPRQYDMNVMFEGCQNLEEVHFDGVFTGTGTTNWLSGVAPTGTFYYYDDSFVIPTERDASHVPAGWTIERAQA